MTDNFDTDSKEGLEPLKVQNEGEFFHEPESSESRPFSRAVRAGGMVYISGHSAPHDPQNGIFRGDTPADEVRNAINYIATILTNADSGLEKVFQVTMLINDKADYAALNAEYRRYFPNGLPARHTALFGVPTRARVAFACVALANKLIDHP